MPTTTIFGWTLPTPGGSTDTWGSASSGGLNFAIEEIDADLGAVKTTADAALPKAGGTMSGALVVGAGGTLTPQTSPSATELGYLGAPHNDQTDSYTLVIGDRGKLIRMNKATATTLTIPANASVAFPVGTTIEVRNVGAGACVLTRDTGVGLYMVGVDSDANRTLAFRGQCVLQKDATNTWYVSGTVS